MRIKVSSLSFFALLFAITTAGAEPTLSRDCAAQDLRLITAIEEHGNAGTVSSDKLAAAYSSVLNARAACRSGQTAQALRLYSDVSLQSQEASAAAK